MAKQTGRPNPREIRSQKAQLESHPHGNEKGIKWKMDVKDGSSEKWGPQHDTSLKGADPQIFELQRLLDSDRSLSAYGLKVEHANNTLQITGIVDTLKDKDHLKSLLSHAGVDRFSDGVSISTDGQMLNEHIELEVKEELEADPALMETGISVQCVNGTIFLAGTVDNRQQEERAIAAARKARGVTRVVSQLSYMPGNMDLDSIFHSQVNNDRDWHRWK